MPSKPGHKKYSARDERNSAPDELHCLWLVIKGVHDNCCVITAACNAFLPMHIYAVGDENWLDMANLSNTDYC